MQIIIMLKNIILAIFCEAVIYMLLNFLNVNNMFARVCFYVGGYLCFVSVISFYSNNITYVDIPNSQCKKNMTGNSAFCVFEEPPVSGLAQALRDTI